MFGLIWKSPERIASSLYEAVAKVVEGMLEDNFLGLDRQSPDYARYSLASGICANLLCESLVTNALIPDYGEKAFRVEMLLQNKHLTHLAEKGNPTIRLSDICVWEVEAAQAQRGTFSIFERNLTVEALTHLKQGKLSAVYLPLVEIVRVLYQVRGFRWLFHDSIEGATQQLKRPYSTSLLMPACRTLIMQTTGDLARAGDETVMRFSVSMMIQWHFLKATVDTVLN